jgi:hypothetical protein
MQLGLMRMCCGAWLALHANAQYLVLLIVLLLHCVMWEMPPWVK